ncbi:MAG: lecithin retinol acyltransferase family protein [Planctomycetes bacterium]|nr:lecithin retinol acyltransferase family protein [Planctomycetota bacterium]
MARGDRLEVEHRIVGSTVTYLHHGVDLGDGTVVHARPHDFRNPFGGGRVVRTTLTEFAEGRGVRLRNEPPAAFSPDVIAERALAHVGRDGYDPVIDNCEHFATWCATGSRTSRQVDIVMGRVAAGVSRAAAAISARAAVGTAERVAIRTAIGTTVRVGLKTMLPAAIVGEAAALAAEWTAHQRGASEQQSRKAGEAAGLAATSLAFAAGGAAAGPTGVVAGAVAGATMWLAGSATAAAATGAARHVTRRLARG